MDDQFLANVRWVKLGEMSQFSAQDHTIIHNQSGMGETMQFLNGQ